MKYGMTGLTGLVLSHDQSDKNMPSTTNVKKKKPGTQSKHWRSSKNRKLIIQIPCFNEAETLPIALAALPRKVSGYSHVEWLIIDDGSTDDTVEVARHHGVDHIVQLRHNEGLARGFMAGIEACLKLGAHTIVNTDADNQYDAKSIPDLVRPILEGEADFVIGARPIRQIEHFSPIKKWLQGLGSWVVRVASRTNVPDAPSGFRAMYWEAALRLNVFSQYTYTLETIIQAGRKNMRTVSVPVGVNEDLRPSRLVKSIRSYVWRSIVTIIRIFLIYRPLKTFMLLSMIFGTAFLLVAGRYMYFFAIGEGDGHVQSLVLAVILATASFLSFSVAVIADLLSVNRSLLEDLRQRALRAEISPWDLNSERSDRADDHIDVG